MKLRPLCLLLLPLWAFAQSPAGLLPPDEQVRRLLLDDPTVRAARSQVRLEEANREKLDAGPYEWSLRVGSQQRRSNPVAAPQERFSEWNTALERPVRLPGKAGLDLELGRRGVAMAETALGDTLHEAARALLHGWFNWLREDAGVTQWQAQVALLDKQAAGIRRRQELGDAARIDSILAEAALAQAQAQLAQAELRRQSAETELRRRYPGLAPTAPATLPEPAAPAGDVEEWVGRIARHSHELALARQASERAALAAERQQRDRLPDPTIGVHVASERGGEEKLIGAFISIPLPGTARRAGAEAASAEAAAIREREAAVARQVEAQAAALYHAARTGQASWLAASQAAERLTHAATLTARAYELGEGNLSDLLSARRLANEGQLAARLAQLEALEAACRLRLDAHELWDFD